MKKIIKKILFPNTYSSEAYIRYLKDKGINIGKKCYIWSPNHTFIDIQRPEFLEIGDFCKITKGVTILCHDYSMSVARRVYKEHVGYSKPTKIGNNVFIGMNATILMGTTIGDNCIIGAGAVVCGTFGNDLVIGGNPARVICSLEDYYKKHKAVEYESARNYVLKFEKKHKRKPTVEEMGNAYAWMYLPRNQETINKYNKIFHLSGDDYDDIIYDFLNSKGMFNSFDEFLESIDLEE